MHSTFLYALSLTSIFNVKFVTVICGHFKDRSRKTMSNGVCSYCLIFSWNPIWWESSSWKLEHHNLSWALFDDCKISNYLHSKRSITITIVNVMKNDKVILQNLVTITELWRTKFDHKNIHSNFSQVQCVMRRVSPAVVIASDFACRRATTAWVKAGFLHVV